MCWADNPKKAYEIFRKALGDFISNNTNIKPYCKTRKVRD